MADHKSAKRRARTSEKRRVNNSNYLSAVKTAVKKFATTLEGLKSGATKDASQVVAAFSAAQAVLMKAASKGILHKKNASRRVGRMAQRMKTTQK